MKDETKPAESAAVGEPTRRVNTPCAKCGKEWNDISHAWGGGRMGSQFDHNFEPSEDVASGGELSNEQLAAHYIRLSGTTRHASDCATSVAPAERPGPCDCEYGPSANIQPAGDALRDARPHAQKLIAYLTDNYLDTTHPDTISSVEKVLWTFARSRSASLEAQRDALQRTITELQDALATAEARNGKLVEALTRYGQHSTRCKSSWMGVGTSRKCNCGFAEVLKEGK